MGMSSGAMEGISGDIGGGFTGDRGTGAGERCGTAGDLAGGYAGANGFNPSAYHPKPQQWPVEFGSFQLEGRGDGHAGVQLLFESIGKPFG